MKLDKQEIAKKLNEKGAIKPCHRCGSNSFSILDGYAKYQIQENIEDLPNTLLGGPSVPFIIIVCNNCGAMTPHAMGALGLLPKQEEKNG
jgi:hypothetical protein